MDRRDGHQADFDRVCEAPATCRNGEHRRWRQVRRAVRVGLVAVVLAAVSACASERKTPDEVLDLIKQETGESGEVLAQRIAVRRESGESDMITLFIVRRPDGSKVLFDSTGERFEPTLDDFRANNDLLDSDDVIVVPHDFPDTPPRGQPGSEEALRFIEVSGHTGTTSRWWFGGAAIGAVGLVLWLWLRKRRVDVEDEPA